MLDKNTWNHLTVCKNMSSGSFRNVINMFTNHVLIYMYKWFITMVDIIKPNQPHSIHNNQVDCNLGVRQLDVGSDVVAEIFWRPRLGSTYVSWRWVLLSDVGSSSSHPLNPRQQYLLLTWCRIVLSLRLCRKMNGGITLLLLVSTQNTTILTRYLVFMNINLSSVNVNRAPACLQISGEVNCVIVLLS